MTQGVVLALIGAAIAVTLAGIGSIKGVGGATEVGMGALAEDSSMFGKMLVLELLPGTQGLYGFIVAFMILPSSEKARSSMTMLSPPTEMVFAA